MKTAIVIGAGPAGLTAANEFVKHSDMKVHVLEADEKVGGISKTVEHNGNRMDIGGHRFFSKNEQVMDWWQELMPVQGAPSSDDVLLVRHKEFAAGGPDPKTTDRVMLIRERVSRIFFLRHFFDYPISAKWATFAGIGFKRAFEAMYGYFKSLVHKLPETSLENFYINHFGKPLYSMFFEDYTEKVWGIHPSKIGADWGAQRVKGISILSLIWNVMLKPFRKLDIRQKTTETSLIEQFVYPKYGPGQLWELAAERAVEGGALLSVGANVVAVNVKDGKVKSVEVEKNGATENVTCDYLLSSMPICDLVLAIRGVDVPAEVKRVASELPYRDFITVGLLVKKLKIVNTTATKTFANRVPDTWIYVQERDVKIGRIQVFNNWSPYMVKDYENTMYIGLEYFCSEGDELWNMSEEDFVKMAIGELEKIDILEAADVLDSIQVKMKKAYPAYFGSYKELGVVREFLDTIPNLYCIGRNGQHRYNNMDHSMLTAIEAVECIVKGKTSKADVWNVNTEQEYHETKA